MKLESKLSEFLSKIGVSLKQLPMIGLFFILCAKFYFLWGVTKMPAPDAPVYIILIRDVIVLGFLLLFASLARGFYQQLRWFWYFFAFAFAVSLFHFLVGQKTLFIWGQHYFRNVFIPILFYPVFIGLYERFRLQAINLVVVSVMVLNILVSYAQIFLAVRVVRPIGLFGDPLISSMILIFGLYAVLREGRWLYTILSVATVIPLIYIIGSISAVFSAAVALIAMLFLYRKNVLHYLRSNMKKSLSVTALLLTVFLLVNWYIQSSELKSVDMLYTKIRVIYETASCRDGNCQPVHWSLQGRLNSNFQPIELCKSNLSECLIGAYSRSNYERTESTWAFLVMNWGLLTCILFYIWIFFHMNKIPQLVKKFGSDRRMEFLIFMCLCLTVFSFFNTLVHKLPLNILFYICLSGIYVSYLRLHKENIR